MIYVCFLLATNNNNKYKHDQFHSAAKPQVHRDL